MALELAPHYKWMLKRGELHRLVRHHPWPHYILDGLIEDESFRVARDRILAQAGAFDLDPNPDLQIQLQYLADEEMAEFFFSAEVRQLLEAIAAHPLTPNERIAIQLRRMTPDSPPFPPHVDAVETKAWAALYYIAPDWTPANGGEVVLLEHETAELRSPRSTWVEPLANRLLLFQTEDQYWHTVRRVHDWERYFIITEWLHQ